MSESTTNRSVELDPVRSAMYGESVPTAVERARLRDEGVEHIDVCGHLVVPLATSITRTPTREGWEPYFVAVNLNATPQKWVTYRRPRGAA